MMRQFTNWRSSDPTLGVEHLHEERLRWRQAGTVLEIEKILALHGDGPQVRQHAHQPVEFVLFE